MTSRFEDFLDTTQGIEDVRSLEAHFYHAVESEGYENIVLARAPRKGILEILCDKFPPGYLDMYWGNHYHMIDPVLQRIQTTRQPFCWDTAFAGNKLSPEEKKFFDACRVTGVHDGITMPFHNPDGGAYLISVSLRNLAKPDPRRVPYVYALAAQTWIRYCALSEQHPAGQETRTRLTARERECLRWAKDGKTNWEISQIIAIAERTVEFHIGNVIRKLNATNRITAIVIAIQEGLIGI